MLPRTLVLTILLTVLASATAQAEAIPAGRHPDVALLPRGWGQLYDETTLFPRPAKWREIPWILDLDEAIALGKKENRPILIWVSGDDPLERC